MCINVAATITFFIFGDKDEFELQLNSVLVSEHFFYFGCAFDNGFIERDIVYLLKVSFIVFMSTSVLDATTLVRAPSSIILLLISRRSDFSKYFSGSLNT